MKQGTNKALSYRRFSRSDFIGIYIQELMKDAIASQPDDMEDEFGPNDIFSQVIGEDKGTYVRGIGLGPSPKDLWGKQDTRLNLRKMAMDAESHSEAQMRQVNEKIDLINGRIEKIVSISCQSILNLTEKRY